MEPEQESLSASAAALEGQWCFVVAWKSSIVCQCHLCFLKWTEWVHDDLVLMLEDVSSLCGSSMSPGCSVPVFRITFPYSWFHFRFYEVTKHPQVRSPTNRTLTAVVLHKSSVRTILFTCVFIKYSMCLSFTLMDISERESQLNKYILWKSCDFNIDISLQTRRKKEDKCRGIMPVILALGCQRWGNGKLGSAGAT